MNSSHRAVFTTIGARTYAETERQVDDYYATEPKAIDLLLGVEEFTPTIWECACGEGHLSKRLEDFTHHVISTDLVDRGYGQGGIDFLTTDFKPDGEFDIITNPPYKYAKQFVEKALDVVGDNGKVAMFLKLTFLESAGRKELFLNNPPTKVYVASSRLNCARNGDFENYPSGAICYAWFVWEKGYKGKTELGWIN